MPTIVIYNPVCGDGTAKSFIDTSVLPLLNKHGKYVDKITPTSGVGDAGTLVFDFIKSQHGPVTVVLASGDGTLHEIINSLSLKGAKAGPGARLHFVLVPCGTANALYASFFPSTDQGWSDTYRLKSVQSFVDGLHTVPLTLAISTLSSSPSEQQKQPTVIVSAVVVSTSLHASILNDSECLRKEMPGVERFKVAAQKNMSRWYNSFAKLLPAPSAGVVQVYDPSKRQFVPHPKSGGDDPTVGLIGPFAYFLSTVNVDRLEPTFCITPLASEIPSTEPSFDMVIVRPLRDPSIVADSPESRAAFVDKLSTTLRGAYIHGSHVDLRYGPDGEIGTEGNGGTVVEYIRCGGWEWIPDDLDDAAHILCSDGAISYIEKGGRVVCSVATPNESAGLMLHI